MKKGIVFLVLASCCFGAPQTFAKLALNLGFNTQSFLICVCLLGCSISFAATRVRKVSLKVTKKQLLYVSTLGAIFFAATSTLITSACRYISPGVAQMVHFVYPIVVMVVMAAVFNEKITKIKMLAIPCALLGVLCFADFSGGSENGMLIGIGLAFLSGFTYAVYVIANDKSCIKELDGFVLTFYIYLVWGLAMAAFALATQSFQWNPVPQSFAYMLGYSVFMLGGVYFIAAGVKRTGATTGALINMLEPMASMIISTIVFRDPIGILTAVGCLFILSSVFITAWAGKIEEQKKQEEQMEIKAL